MALAMKKPTHAKGCSLVTQAAGISQEDLTFPGQHEYSELKKCCDVKHPEYLWWENFDQEASGNCTDGLAVILGDENLV